VMCRCSARSFPVPAGAGSRCVWPVQRGSTRLWVARPAPACNAAQELTATLAVCALLCESSVVGVCHEYCGEPAVISAEMIQCEETYLVEHNPSLLHVDQWVNWVEGSLFFSYQVKIITHSQ
jgi:hypothetical protein